MSESLKARTILLFKHFCFYKLLNLNDQLSWVWKKFYNLCACQTYWNKDTTTNSDYNKEMTHSQITDQPRPPRGKAKDHRQQQDNKKTIWVKQMIKLSLSSSTRYLQN